ncbi:MAG: cyclophilin-like fold protein [Pseudomonadota bacterium]|nr:cyclophilin-like fold protein [Pseudomonadota bacterium]
MKIRIEVSGLEFTIRLSDTPTAEAIIAALPFESSAQTWGEEVYFSTPVKAKLEADARQVVEPGTVCFWTEGDALALPFGRTPMSTDERPKLANRCNVLGKIAEDAKLLSRVKSGDKVTVTKV